MRQRHARPCAPAASRAPPPRTRRTKSLQATAVSLPHPFGTVPDDTCSGKLPGGILTTVKRSLILAPVVALLAVSSAQAGNGKVLAVKFDADVNPVTQKWL